jgi:hypothetical protein
LFSAPALEQFEDRRRGEELIAVNYFAGLMAGEIDALIDSFAGEPELHHPVRGRVKGERAFAAFVSEANAWFEERHVSVEDVDLVVTERRGVEEVVLHLAGEAGRWISRLRSSPTGSPAGGSTSCGSTSARGR